MVPVTSGRRGIEMLECTSSPLALKKLTARDWTLPCTLADGTAVFTEHEEDQ